MKYVTDDTIVLVFVELILNKSMFTGDPYRLSSTLVGYTVQFVLCGVKYG